MELKRRLAVFIAIVLAFTSCVFDVTPVYATEDILLQVSEEDVQSEIITELVEDDQAGLSSVLQEADEAEPESAEEYSGDEDIPESEGNIKDFPVDTDGEGLTYTFDEDEMTATVTGWTGSGAVVIPKTATHDDVEYNVTSIGNNAFQENKDHKLTAVTLPETLTNIGSRAFSKCTSLNKIVIPDAVTKIGYDAFEGCTSLTEVKLSGNLEELGNEAFKGCTELPGITIPKNLKQTGTNIFNNCPNFKDVTIENGLAEIPGWIFYGCGSLEELEIPGTVTNIGPRAFGKCSSLKKIVIPDAVIKIEYDAFEDCTSLTEVKLSGNLEELGNEVFNGCTELPGITIPKSLKETGTNIFTGCPNFKDVTLENGLTEIPGWIFYGCSSLEEIEIPGTVTKIGPRAFSKCSNLKKIVIPDAVTKIEYDAFEDCTSLTEVKLSGNLEELGNEVFNGCTELPGITIPKSLKETGTNIFTGCPNFKDVTIENGLTEIPGWIFYGCASLEKIEIPETVTKIGPRAFSKCSNLKKIVIPDAVTKIEYDAFEDCTSLTEVKLSAYLEELGNEVFNGCTELPGITIPKSLSQTGTNIFTNCTNFKDVKFEEGRTEIPGWIFYGCGSLEEIEIPGTVTGIGPRAFNKCSNLKKIVIPDAVAKIEYDAFEDCTSLEEVKLSDNLEELGNEVFKGCSGLKRITFPDSLSTFSSGLFANCTSLEEMTIPETIKEIGGNTFAGCTSLNKIQLPSTLEKIPYSMFYGCTALKEINWPVTLTEIGGSAFGNCDSLESVDLTGCVELKTMGDSVFKDCDALTTVKLSSATTTIGSSAFYGCDLIKNVELGSGITSIPDSMFAECPVLESIVLPKSVKSIGDNAFKNDIAFVDISIPDTTTKISSSAFSYPMKMTCHGVNGSYAETYAHEKGMKFDGKGFPVTSIMFVKDLYTVIVGNTVNTAVSVEPVNYSGTLTYTSSDNSIFTVDEKGTVRGVEGGESTLTVKSPEGVSANTTIKVIRPVTGVNISQTTAEINKGGTLQLTATVNPEKASNKNVSWTSDKEGIATVDNTGLVTAVALGDATITVKTEDGGYERSCAVKVIDGTIVSVDKITIDHTSKTIKPNETFKITYTLSPNNATNKTVVWSSSNEGVATVDGEGTVTGKNVGTATITVKTEDGSVSAACEVTVEQAQDKKVTVSFNSSATDVANPPSIEVTVNKPYGDLPSVSRNGYKFLGWFTTAGTKVEKTTVVQNETAHTLYAHWQNTSPVDEKVTVSFNTCTANVANPSSIEVTVNKPYGNLPTVTRTGYKFLGWYTSATGGTKVEKTTVVQNKTAHTLYAHWELKQSGGVNTGLDGSVVTAKKVDISNAFDKSPTEKYKYKIYDKSQKKYASVNTSGILTAKKPGEVEVTLLKKEGKTWVDTDQTITLEIVVPKGRTIPFGIAYYEGQEIDINDYIIGSEGYEPDSWDTSKLKSDVATFDSETGIMTVGSKNGTANVYAIYGGKNPRKIKIAVKISHKKVDITSAFEPITAKVRFKILEKQDKKIATVNNKGVLTVKKAGTVTVTRQEKVSGKWIVVDWETFDVELPLEEVNGL